MITQFLKKVISNISEKKEWPYKIPELQTILNSTTSSSRNYSPFFLTFLKHPNFPFQELLQSKPHYLDNSLLATRFNLSNQLVKECKKALEDSFAQAKTSFDNNARPNKIHIGDTVYVETSQRWQLHYKLQTDARVHIK